MVKDKLIIDGCTFTVALENNVAEVNALLNVSATCERKDENLKTLVFLGSHSPFSNLHPCQFTVDNVTYNSVEQFIQSSKAMFFDNDVLNSKIMKGD